MIGRQVLSEEEASANYRLRRVRLRRTGGESWEVIDSQSGKSVASGLGDRAEALRLIRAWERLSAVIEGGLDRHRLLQ